jgi:hypothetical protein
MSDAAPIGAPSKYTDQIASDICQHLAEGKSLRAICLIEGYPNLSTVIRWLAHKDSSFDNFRAQYARAREAQADYFFDEIIEIADDGSRDYKKSIDGQESVDHDHIARSKLRVDARKWAASKMQPKKYGDKIMQEHSGPDGKPIEHREITDEVRAAALAAFVAKNGGLPKA